MKNISTNSIPSEQIHNDPYHIPKEELIAKLVKDWTKVKPKKKKVLKKKKAKKTK